MQKDKLKQWIEELIAKKELWRFYKSKEWTELKEKILEENHYECEICRSNGIITRYDIDAEGNKRLLSTVHHVQFVRKHPALALSRTYTYKGKEYKNLIPVCKACHNKLHPEKRKKRASDNGERFVNEERW
ncbi:MAG: HNH endonuclease [Lachnospiraceae bacterium]|nr:HNH endonuclease [Lachnospiraceae bacterium]